MPLLYFFTILRRSFVFWLGVRLALVMVATLGSRGSQLVQLVWFGPEAVVFLIAAVATLVLLDLRGAREHILLGNLGMAGWKPAVAAGVLVLSLELGVFVIHCQVMGP